MGKYTPGPWAPNGGRTSRENVGPEIEANARLMAAAPEMLDLLREMEWSGHEHSASGDGYCPLCLEGPGKYVGPGEHRPDCKLAALLKRLA